MELEEKLRAKEAAEQRGAPHTPESLPESSMSTTGRYEQLPPQSQIEELLVFPFVPRKRAILRSR